MTEPVEQPVDEPIEQRIAKARKQLEATKAAVARAEQSLRDTTETVRSRDRAVEATVGPQGELTGLKFLDNKHLSMTGPQLAASVMEAAQEGRRKVAQRVMDTFEPLTRPNPDLPGGRGIQVDWDRIFGSALNGGKRRNGRPADAGLRDEIHEDTDDVPGGRS